MKLCKSTIAKMRKLLIEHEGYRSYDFYLYLRMKKLAVSALLRNVSAFETSHII